MVSCNGLTFMRMGISQVNKDPLSNLLMQVN